MAAWYCAKQGTSLTTVIQVAVKGAKVNIKDFLAGRTVIDEFYDMVGAKPLSIHDLERFYQGFLFHLKLFNEDLKVLRLIYENDERLKRPAELVIDPTSIDLLEPEQLKPDSSSVQEYRETIASWGIGEGWWKRRKKTRPGPETESEGEEASIDG